MTKKEFKAAMLCGLGRCVEAVKENPEKYRNYVLSACRKNISYDVQVEGTRAQYVYTMVKCYPDVETFVKAAIQPAVALFDKGFEKFGELGSFLFLSGGLGGVLGYVPDAEFLISIRDAIIAAMPSDKLFRDIPFCCDFTCG